MNAVNFYICGRLTYMYTTGNTHTQLVHNKLPQERDLGEDRFVGLCLDMKWLQLSLVVL